jgi:23S rRNA (adenine2503-C2)-methyltransferase
LHRNLTPAEIVNQILAVRSLVPQKPAITNLVFMGMGEPLANFPNVVKAITIILAPWGLNFSSRRVTVSTAGLAPLIPALGKAVRVNLAVSLNAPNDALRRHLMPVTAKYPLAQVLEACRAFPLPPHRRITFSYVLLKGINDSPAQARELARLLRGLRAKINLIAFNPHPDLPFQRPDPDTVLAFQDILIQAHYTTLVRESRGTDISAACGQLAGEANLEDNRFLD